MKRALRGLAVSTVLAVGVAALSACATTPDSRATSSAAEDDATLGEATATRPAPASVSGGTVAVYGELLPGVDPAIAIAVAESLDAGGTAATVIRQNDLLNPARFTPSVHPILIIPESSTFPAEALDAVTAYLKKGGHLITLNGPAFTNPCWRESDTKDADWIDLGAMEAGRSAVKPERVLFNFEPEQGLDPATFERDTSHNDRRSVPELVADGAAGTGHSLRVTIDDFGAWESYAIPMTESVDADQALTTFWAKGGEHTTMLAIEWREKDGARWIATIPLSARWQYYVLPATAFVYWHNSPSGTKRGFPGDLVRMDNLLNFRPGLALSHTYIGSGAHQFWIDEVGVARDPVAGGAARYAAPVLDTISPDYKLYPIKNLETVRVSPFINDVMLTSHGCREYKPFSPIGRATGAGFDNDRIERFIPIVEAYDACGQRAGTLAHLALQLDSDYPHSFLGSITLGNSSAYKDPMILQILKGMVDRVERGVCFTEAGSSLFAYFHDTETVPLGAGVLNLHSSNRALRVRFAIESLDEKKTVFQKEISLSAAPGGVTPVRATWSAKKFGSEVYRVTSELIEGDAVIDRIEHEFTVFTPSKKPVYMIARDGQLVLPDTGEPWFPFGTNYMPSYLASHEDRDYFEHFLDARDYDPEIVETDLWRIRHVLGMNMVNLFIYSGRPYNLNLVDLLNRCRRHGLRVTLALRPFANPLEFDWSSPEELLARYRLAEQDIVFAYDIAWEPWWGKYELRSKWDGEWEQWIADQYGSLANAERDWDFAVPRTAAGTVTCPADAQLEGDGAWLRMVAAYRRFVDDFLHRKYNYAIRRIKKRDPNHLVSFRMSEAGNPLCPQGGYPFDLRSIAKAVDLFEPEGYGRFGYVRDNTRTGIFTTWYAKSMIDKPVMWAEFGFNQWGGSNFATQDRLRKAGRVGYDNFLEMVLDSGSAGGNTWYYASGYRVDERSDYGMLDPDGAPRPQQQPFIAHGPAIMNRQNDPRIGPFKPDVWLEIDRDLHADGINGIYREVKDEFWRQVNDEGKVVGLRTAGMGTNSRNTPLVAVGNTKYTGANPPKYLNAAFNFVKCRNANGAWVDVEPGETIDVAAGQPVVVRISVGNTGDATWLSPPSIAPGAAATAAAARTENAKGTVFLTSLDGSDVSCSLPIDRDVPFGGDVEWKDVVLIDRAAKPAAVALRMEARDRAAFGEIVRFRISPK